MMRKFSMVSPQLWRSKRFRGLPSDDSRLLYLFLLTSEHQTCAGTFRLPDAYTANDLQWSTDKVKVARASLVDADLVVHDPDTDEYFILRWLKHNPPTNPKHRAGVERLILDEIASEIVGSAAVEELYQLDLPPPPSKQSPLPNPKPPVRREFAGNSQSR